MGESGESVALVGLPVLIKVVLLLFGLWSRRGGSGLLQGSREVEGGGLRD
jgi:hypothetical protein